MKKISVSYFLIHDTKDKVKDVLASPPMYSRERARPQKYPYREQRDEFNIRYVCKENIGRPVIKDITTYVADSLQTLNKILMTADKVMELLHLENPNKKKKGRKKLPYIHIAIRLGIPGMDSNKPIYIHFIEIQAIQSAEHISQSYAVTQLKEKFLEMTWKIKQINEIVESSKMNDIESLKRPLYIKPKEKSKKKHSLSKKDYNTVLSSIAEIGVPSTKIILFVTISRTGEAEEIYESIRFANFKRNLQKKK